MKNKNKFNRNITTCILIICMLSTLISPAQRRNNGIKINSSHGGNNYSEIFHAISIQTAYDIEAMPFFGVGYTCIQLSRRDNSFFQENICYNIGYHLKQSIISHNIIFSIYGNNLGSLNLNPFVYGIAFHFILAPDLDEIYDNFNTNEYPGQMMSNLYIRPEIGISLPLKYNKKVTSCILTYGYNFQTFWQREEIIKYKENLATIENNENTLMPYTSMNHHMVSLKLNFRIISKNSRVYFK